MSMGSRSNRTIGLPFHPYVVDRSGPIDRPTDQARKQPAMWKWWLLWWWPWCPPPPPPEEPEPWWFRWWWMMPWTRRKWSTPQGMVMAPFCSKPYSSSAALSSATNRGCFRYPTGTTNRSSSSSCCSSFRTTLGVAWRPARARWLVRMLGDDEPGRGWRRAGRRRRVLVWGRWEGEEEGRGARVYEAAAAAAAAPPVRPCVSAPTAY
ncbi:hypothetical protein BDA96_10G341600 [Sorghum bicolor]|uniref:Uncharacterized protein n=1 Tax=Sorghum bicolor TaxID=4558 RepID=A0A921Q5X8_SORBI|nr:hypothetical protein BDA96_10G341600 [Sorghum bicolor]